MSHRNKKRKITSPGNPGYVAPHKCLQPTLIPNHKIKPFFASPAYDGMYEANFVLSITEAACILVSQGIVPTLTTMKNGAFIDVVRNRYVQKFLATDCTHLFFIDSDLKFEARAVLALLTSGLPVCAGVYPKRQEPMEFPIRCVPDPETGNVWAYDKWVMCDRVPTGFLCIRRDVIEEMVKDAGIIRCQGEPDLPRLFYTYLNENQAYVGEDFAWCIDYCKKYDTVIPVWADFDFTHGERFKGNWHNFMLEQAAKGEPSAQGGPEREKIDLREAISQKTFEDLEASNA